MAIRFTNKSEWPASDGGKQPAKKQVGGKTYVAEEPAADRPEKGFDLPFAKPVKPEKKRTKQPR